MIVLSYNNFIDTKSESMIIPVTALPPDSIPPFFTGSVGNGSLPFDVPIIGELHVPGQVKYFLQSFPVEVPEYQPQNYGPFVHCAKQLTKLADGLVINECGELFDPDAKSHIANLQKQLEALNLDKVFMTSFLIGWIMRQEDPDACKWSQTFHLRDIEDLISIKVVFQKISELLTEGVYESLKCLVRSLEDYQPERPFIRTDSKLNSQFMKECIASDDLTLKEFGKAFRESTHHPPAIARILICALRQNGQNVSRILFEPSSGYHFGEEIAPALYMIVAHYEHLIKTASKETAERFLTGITEDL
jgi:hypothetical protein